MPALVSANTHFNDKKTESPFSGKYQCPVTTGTDLLSLESQKSSQGSRLHGELGVQ